MASDPWSEALHVLFSFALIPHTYRYTLSGNADFYLVTVEKFAAFPARANRQEYPRQ